MNAAELDALTISLGGVSQTFLAISIIILMFAIALGLKPENFTFLRTRPTLFWGGLAAQIIALPLATLALAAILQPSPSIALGMIVVAACPGGSVSNFMTYLARGDTAYSVSLTAGSSVIACLWTPAAILLWSDLYPPTAALLETIDFNRASFVLQTTMMLAIPIALGMILQHKFPALADRARGPLGFLGAGILATVILAGTAKFLPILIGAWALIMVPVVAHNALAFGLGAAAGRLLPTNSAQRRSLTFEVGIQNTGLAIVLLLSQLQGLGGAASIAIVWGVWHFFSGGVMIAIFRRWSLKEKTA